MPYEKFARADRQLAALTAVEALRAYAAANGGKLPEQLDDVVETPVPANPMTGKPFTYAVSNGVATISDSTSWRSIGIYDQDPQVMRCRFVSCCGWNVKLEIECESPGKVERGEKQSEERLSTIREKISCGHLSTFDSLPWAHAWIVVLWLAPAIAFADESATPACVLAVSSSRRTLFRATTRSNPDAKDVLLILRGSRRSLLFS